MRPVWLFIPGADGQLSDNNVEDEPGFDPHNYFSLSIRTAGALLPSTDFIGTTDIVKRYLQLGVSVLSLYTKTKRK